MLKEYLFPLKERKEIAQETMAFWFDTSDTDFSFQAGQFVIITLINPPYVDEKTNSRSFSIASSPTHKDFFMIAMRMRNSGYKSSLQEIPLGTKVKVVGPFGHFILQEGGIRPAVFLAGGIGVTPVRSIIEWATKVGLKRQIYLFYSNRVGESCAFLDDFRSFTQTNPYFKFVPTITENTKSSPNFETGRIGEEMLKKYLPSVQPADYYIVGPPEMVLAMKEVLANLNVRQNQIITESFSGYAKR